VAARVILLRPAGQAAYASLPHFATATSALGSVPQRGPEDKRGDEVVPRHDAQLSVIVKQDF
jgi:hypothetical protein